MKIIHLIELKNRFSSVLLGFAIQNCQSDVTKKRVLRNFLPIRAF